MRAMRYRYALELFIVLRRDFQWEHVKVAGGELMATQRGSGKYFHAREAPEKFIIQKVQMRGRLCTQESWGLTKSALAHIIHCTPAEYSYVTDAP